MLSDGDPRGGAVRLADIVLRADADVPVRVRVLLQPALHLPRHAPRPRRPHVLAAHAAHHRRRARAQVLTHT